MIWLASPLVKKNSMTWQNALPKRGRRLEQPGANARRMRLVLFAFLVTAAVFLSWTRRAMAIDIAHRVAARFTGTAANDDDIEFSNEVMLSTDQLREELERRLGPLALLTIHDPQGGTGISRWEAISAEGNTVRGTVTVTTVWLDGALHVWSEIEIACAVAASTRAAPTSPPPRQLLDDRLRQVAVRLRRLLNEVRVQPQVPSAELASDLQKVVELAERS